MKTWEIYKMLDEWDTNTDSPYVRNKANDLIYIFVFDGENKGLKLAEDRYKGKTQYHFSLNGEWEIVNNLFDVGDHVTDTMSNKVHKVKSVLNDGWYKTEDNVMIHQGRLRKATNQDIRLLEKWNNIGRNMNEFKKWDIVKDIDGSHGFHYREVLSIHKEHARCTGGVDIHESNLSLVTPLERRFDTE